LGLRGDGPCLARGGVGGDEVAKREVEIGFDCVGDGEYWPVLNVKWFDQRMTGLGTRR